MGLQFYMKIYSTLKNILSSKLFHSISIYTFFRLLNRSLPVILLPFLTHYLTPKDYSLIDIFTNLVSIVIPLIGLNTVSSTSRFYFDNSVSYHKFVSTIVTFNLITFLAFIPLSFIFNNILFKFINVPFISFFLFYVVLFSFLEQNTIVHLTNLRLENKPFEYGLIGLIRTIIELFATLFIIIYLTRSWGGRIGGQFLGLITISIFSIYKLYVNNYLSLTFDYKYLKDALTYSIPLIVHTITGILLGFTNRFFIIKFVGIQEAGIFASAYQLCFVISLFHTSFNEAWMPYLFKEITLNNNLQLKIKLTKITYLYAFFLIIITISVIGMIPVIYKIIGKSFQIDFSVLFWILFGFLFNGLYKMFVNYLFYFKKTNFIALGTVLTFLLNLVLNYFLIKESGVIGAAIALCITFFVHFLIFFIISNKYFPLPWFYFLKKTIRP